MIVVTDYAGSSDTRRKLSLLGIRTIGIHHSHVSNIMGRDKEVVTRFLEQSLEGCTGLVLSGGEDINPARYLQEPDPRTGKPNDSRDLFESVLMMYAIEKGIKILGVCRGHQLINVTLGGTLHQHIGNHGATNRVNLANFGKDLFGSDQIVVNSLHHQAVDKLGDSLEVCGTSWDGYTEMIYSSKYNALGVQWHPEWMEGTNEVYQWLIN